ncbi:MAG TPA: cation diffusion facilitator family transporter [Rhizomicrobium sp.]|nr:cation diffusion facilitator family transporter [Rhizomicrobium sp.]
MAEHTHEHGQGHGHHHHLPAPADFGTAFLIAIVLNLGFVFAEATYGVLSNSMALIADAGHNLGDVLGLVVAWIASKLVQRAPSERFTYGLRSSSILAALFNAVFLLVATGAIAVEAIQRFFTPEPVAGKTVIIVAAIGIAINFGTAMLFARGAKSDLNIRGAFQHMMADAAVSVGVVIAGFAILATGYDWIDPVVSLLVSVVIVWGTWGLLRDSMRMSLHAVPPEIDPQAVRVYLEKLPGVCAIHDLHIWSMSTTEVALTCHLIYPDGHPGDAELRRIAAQLRNQFAIPHVTIQVETDEQECALHGHAV